MFTFRDETPKRRNITRLVTKYNEHKEDLVKDFKNRCGYCNTIDTWRYTWYEIDHFVPKEYLQKLTDKCYSNLVYTCRSCNNAKRAKWPTKDEIIHNDGKNGFIDPCTDEFSKLFYRRKDGSIGYQKTELSSWIYHNLKFYKSIHTVTWNIEHTSNEIDDIKLLIKDKGIETIINSHPLLMAKIYHLFDKYYDLTKNLSSYSTK